MKKKILFIIFIATSSSVVSQIKPNNLTDLVLWLRADSNVVLNGSTISQWIDCSASNNSASQTVPLYQPFFVTGALNDMPVLYFDGINDFLEGTTIPNINNNSISIFIVTNGMTYSGSNASPLFGVDCYPNQFGFSRSSIDEALNVNNTGTYANGLISFGGLLPNSGFAYSILEFTKDFNVISKIFANGVFLNSTSSPSQIGPFANGNYSIGLGSGGCYSDFHNGNIAEIIIYNRCLSENERIGIEQYLRFKYAKQIDLGVDISIPYGFKDTTLNAHLGFSNYLWSTGQTDSVISVNQSGLYWVQANDFFSMLCTDSIFVTYPNTDLNYSNDTIICLGSSLLLTSVIPDPGLYSYLWSSGDTTNSLVVSTTGNYWVKITDSLGYYAYSDTIQIVVDSFPSLVSLGPDLSFCSGNSISLDPPLPNPQSLNYTWNDGSHDTLLIIIDSGSYAVTVIDENACLGTDSILIDIVGVAPTPFFVADTVCFGDTTHFMNLSTYTGFDSIIRWHWDFTLSDTSNLENPVMVFQSAGIHYVSLLAQTIGGCTKIFSKNVIVRPAPFIDFIGNLACVNHSIQFSNLSSVIPNDSVIGWDWDFGDGSSHSFVENPSHTYLLPDSFNVVLDLQTIFGCTKSLSKQIIVVSAYLNPSGPVLLAPTNNLFAGDTAINFSWQASQNATRYRIIAATDSLFNSSIFDVLLDSLNYYYSFNNNTQTVFWKVLSYNICSDSTASGIFRFNIFNPEHIGGLNLWLRADYGITKDSNNYVSQWDDYSGFSNTADQFLQSSRPLSAISAVLNQHTIINFDGIDDFFNGTTISGIANSSMSIFIVANGLSTLGNQASPMFGVNCFPNQFGICRYSFHQALVCTNTGLYSDGLMSAINSYSNSGFNYTIIGYTKEYNAISTIYANGNFLISTLNSSQVGSFTNGNYYIGLGNSGCYTDYFHGNIAEIIVYDTALSDNQRIDVENYLRYKYAPPVTLGPDINIPYGFCDTILDAGSRFTNFLWSTGDTTQSITVNNGGAYWVSVMDVFGFTSTDTVLVNKPSLHLPDTALCLFVPADLSPGLSGPYSYLWSTGDTTTNCVTDTSGLYWLQLTDTSGCTITDDFIVTIDSFAVQASLGPDRNICQGNIIGLESGAGEATSYLWSNGSGNSLIAINDPPVISVEYSVTVMNANGCIAEDTVLLNVNGVAAQPLFSSDSACLGSPTQFADLSTVQSPFTIVSWIWDFGDGDTSVLQNPAHIFSSNGAHNVALNLITDSGCVSSIIGSAIVYALPQVDFMPHIGCTADTISFTDQTFVSNGSLYSWSWDFDDPASGTANTSNLQDPTHVFADPGNYGVSLIVTTAAGCAGNITDTVLIRQSPVVDFSYTLACDGSPVYFADQTQTFPWNEIQEWTWAFGDGDTSYYSSPSHIFDDAGTYDVTLSVWALSGCIASVTLPVTVIGIPEAGFIAPSFCVGQPGQLTDTSFCLNDSIVSWTWLSAGSGSLTDQNPWLTFANAGVFSVTLWVESSAGCKDSAVRNVNVYPLPQASFTFDPAYGAPPLTVSFTNTSTGDIAWYWDFIDGDFSSESDPVHEFTEQGIYDVILTAYGPNGCADTATGRVFVIPTTVDIAVTNVGATELNGFLSFNADVINYGNHAVENIDLLAHMNQGDVIREQWTGSLMPGESFTWDFSTQLLVPSGVTAEFLCVHAAIPGFEPDDVPGNNDFCAVLIDGFSASAVYPDPVSESVNIDIILPFKDVLNIELFDMLGHSLGSVINKETAGGLTKIIVPVSHLRQGVYSLRISFSGKLEIRHFVKI